MTDESIKGTPWRTTREAAELMRVAFGTCRRLAAQGWFREDEILRVNPRLNLIHVNGIKRYLKERPQEDK